MNTMCWQVCVESPKYGTTNGYVNIFYVVYYLVEWMNRARVAPVISLRPRSISVASSNEVLRWSLWISWRHSYPAYIILSYFPVRCLAWPGASSNNRIGERHPVHFTSARGDWPSSPSVTSKDHELVLYISHREEKQHKTTYHDGL